jgi:DNA-binding transcriptional ArsR family regulator
VFIKRSLSEGFLRSERQYWPQFLDSKEERMHNTAQEKMVLSSECLQMAAALAKGLADENRLRILYYLSNGKKSVSSIVGELNLSQPLVSHHLRELKRYLLVHVERNGPFIFYEIVDPKILNIVQMLAAVARELFAKRKTF